MGCANGFMDLTMLKESELLGGDMVRKNGLKMIHNDLGNNFIQTIA